MRTIAVGALALLQAALGLTALGDAFEPSSCACSHLFAASTEGAINALAAVVYSATAYRLFITMKEAR